MTSCIARLLRTLKPFLLVVATAILATPLVWAQGNYQIPQVLSEPDIDGIVDDAEWAGAISIPIDIETNPGNNVQAEVSARALLMEDGEVLYVAFIADDPEPGQIRAFYRDRDTAWDDDWIAIIMDTFNDERRAYEFFVNPLGVQMDAIYDDTTGREDDSWNAIWDSAGQITADGFTAEIWPALSQMAFQESSSRPVVSS